MKPLFFMCLLISFIGGVESYRDPWLYCDVCLCTVQEINHLLSVTDAKESIEVSGFRIDQNVEKVPVKKSEVYLSEVMDVVCDAMYMYGIFTNPKTNQRNVIRAHSFEGLHAPPTKKHTKQGPEITDSLMFACDTILEDFEDDIIQFFKARDPKSKDTPEQTFCVNKAKLCTEVNVQTQMWAMAEAALLAIGNVNKPQEEEDPAMEDIEVEYIDLTREGEAEEEEIKRNQQRLEEIREKRRLREEEEKRRKEEEELSAKKQEL